MAIKHKGITRINDNGDGIFLGCVPGNGDDFPAAAEGKMWFRQSDKNMYIHANGNWQKLTS